MTVERTLYGSDVRVDITASGINLSTATQIQFILRKSGIPDIILTKTGGDIVANSSTTATVEIPKSAITAAGVYEIKIIVTSSGKDRGLVSETTHILYE